MTMAGHGYSHGYSHVEDSPIREYVTIIKSWEAVDAERDDVEA